MCDEVGLGGKECGAWPEERDGKAGPGERDGKPGPGERDDKPGPGERECEAGPEGSLSYNSKIPGYRIVITFLFRCVYLA